MHVPMWAEEDMGWVLDFEPLERGGSGCFDLYVGGGSSYLEIILWYTFHLYTY